MKRIFYSVIVVIALTANAVWSQETPENAILLFDGSVLDIRFSFYSHLLSQPRMLPCGDNPATLSFVEARSIQLRPNLGFSANIRQFYDIDNAVQREMDNAIQQYRLPDSEITYPVISPVVGLQSGLNHFSAVLPLATAWGNFTLMAAFSQPLAVDLAVLGGGFTTLIETRKHVGDQDMIVHMRLRMNMNLDFRMAVTQTQLGFASQLGNGLAAGIQLSRYHLSTILNAKFKIDGIMETAGTEYAFNDPYDPRIDFAAGEQNDLNQAVTADFAGAAWGIKLGGLYRLSPHFTVGSTLELNPTWHLKGRMEVMQNKILALNVDALFSDDPEAKLVDPTKLNLDKLTLTERAKNPTDNSLDLELPSNFGLALVYQTAIFTTAIQWKGYWGQLAYDFLNESRGLKLKHGFDLDVHVGFLSLKAGVIFANLSSGPSSVIKNLPLPQLTLGGNFRLLKNYPLTSQIVLAPAPTVQLGVGYLF